MIASRGTPSTFIFLSHVPTHAASDVANFVASQFDRWSGRLRESFSLGLRRGVFEELYKVGKECNTPNWDGYGAEPVCSESVKYAKSFLEALPLGTAAPTVGAEPDGHLTLEWHRTSRRTLSVSVSPDGELHYAALLGASKRYGTEPFFGDVPTPILDLISRVDCI